MGVLPFPEPAWLSGHSEPNVDEIVSMLSDEAQRLYREYLAEEARKPRGTGMHPAWSAFDRMDVEMTRRHRARDVR